jgi:hypothetical protein
VVVKVEALGHGLAHVVVLVIVVTIIIAGVVAASLGGRRLRLVVLHIVFIVAAVAVVGLPDGSCRACCAEPLADQA